MARITVATAADQTGVPRRTIAAAILRGELRATKISDTATSAYTIDQRDLDRWVNRRTKAAS